MLALSRLGTSLVNFITKQMVVNKIVPERQQNISGWSMFQGLSNTKFVFRGW
jgi:hypothetical protein